MYVCRFHVVKSMTACWRSLMLATWVGDAVKILVNTLIQHVWALYIYVNIPQVYDAGRRLSQQFNLRNPCERMEPGGKFLAFLKLVEKLCSVTKKFLGKTWQKFLENLRILVRLFSQLHICQSWSLQTKHFLLMSDRSSKNFSGTTLVVDLV